jgi:hypothetical protein
MGSLSGKELQMRTNVHIVAPWKSSLIRITRRTNPHEHDGVTFAEAVRQTIREDLHQA